MPCSSRCSAASWRCTRPGRAGRAREAGGHVRIAIDRSAWSGDGDFTQLLLARLASIEQVGYLRVEDAPASRAGPAFNFICNEIYLGFRIARTLGSRRFLGV